MKMNISQAGLALIKKYEGFRSDWYRCPAGIKTIGYGHAYRDGDDFDDVTQSFAENLLRKDVAAFEKQINGLKLNLSQHQYDSLVSFVYNIGFNAFIKSNVYKMLNKGDTDASLVWWAKWVGNPPLPGLVKRRNEEISMFKKS